MSLLFLLFYFKFEVRFSRFVLLCLDDKVFTSVFIWLLFAFFSKRKGRCVEGVVFVCFLSLGCVFLVLASFRFKVCFLS